MVKNNRQQLLFVLLVRNDIEVASLLDSDVYKTNAGIAKTEETLSNQLYYTNVIISAALVGFLRSMYLSRIVFVLTICLCHHTRTLSFDRRSSFDVIGIITRSVCLSFRSQ